MLLRNVMTFPNFFFSSRPRLIHRFQFIEKKNRTASTLREILWYKNLYIFGR